MSWSSEIKIWRRTLLEKGGALSWGGYTSISTRGGERTNTVKAGWKPYSHQWPTLLHESRKPILSSKKNQAIVHPTTPRNDLLDFVPCVSTYLWLLLLSLQLVYRLVATGMDLVISSVLVVITIFVCPVSEFVEFLQLCLTSLNFHAPGFSFLSSPFSAAPHCCNTLQHSFRCRICGGVCPFACLWLARFTVF